MAFHHKYQTTTQNPNKYLVKHKRVKLNRTSKRQQIYTLVSGQKPPGQKPPDKNPLDKNPPCQKPPDKNPPDKTYEHKIYFT